MSRQIGLALGVAILVALLGAAPALGDFRGGYWQMIVGGLLAAAVAVGFPGPWFTRRVRLPERIEGDGLVLRRWRVEDAELLHEAVVDSVGTLSPVDAVDRRRADVRRAAS